MPDRFSSHSTSLVSPATHGFTVTPDDGTELAEITRALYVGSAGTLALLLASGAEVTLAGLPAGTMLPLRVRQVKATGTTAGQLVGLL